MRQQSGFLVVGIVLTLLLQWAAAGLGPAGIFVNLSVPLPAAYALLRGGPAIGAGVVALTTGALFALGEAAGATAYLLQFGLASLVLPALLRRGWSWDRAVVATLAVVVGVVALTVGGYAASRGLPVSELASQYVQGEVDRALAIYEAADLPEAQIQELTEVAQRMAELLLVAYPGLVVVVTGGLLFLMVLFLSAFARGRYVLAGPDFARWKASEVLVWPLIAAGLGVAFGDGLAGHVALNVLVVLLPIYFLQGLAIVTYFFRKKGISPALRAMGYVLIAILNPLPLIVTGLGVFDLWVDFRKPRIRNT
ncbi:DUF2232 domain-containing protein [Desulfuromonas sp.]|uniref:DUF2232 domain-containing protein n=1 Tax=Desulfuromonas sp. TaxID=892 RepID=UPI0025B7B2FC|nr:DUF2232 domain-containing protein [Desulfuromonas sp.]